MHHIATTPQGSSYASPTSATFTRWLPGDPAQLLTEKLARAMTGHVSGLGSPSKMPGPSTALSAARCHAGSKLATVKGSTCSACYAKRGNYATPAVKDAHERRYQALTSDPVAWEAGMVYLIGAAVNPLDPVMRIHDSGDFQSTAHVLLWCRVAQRLPWVRFWAPSREARMVRAARLLRGAAWPPNLTIRMSAAMIGEPVRGGAAVAGLPTSTVDSGIGWPCPARHQGNACGACRACWSSEVANVDYHRH